MCATLKLVFGEKWMLPYLYLLFSLPFTQSFTIYVKSVKGLIRGVRNKVKIILKLSNQVGIRSDVKIGNLLAICWYSQLHFDHYEDKIDISILQVSFLSN